MRRPGIRWPSGVAALWRLEYGVARADGPRQVSFVLDPSVCAEVLARPPGPRRSPLMEEELRHLERLLLDGRRWRCCARCMRVSEEALDDDGEALLRHHTWCGHATWTALSEGALVCHYLASDRLTPAEKMAIFQSRAELIESARIEYADDCEVRRYRCSVCRLSVPERFDQRGCLRIKHLRECPAFGFTRRRS
jgi:hypothetical protein